MRPSLYQEIVQERRVRSERIVAVARLSFISLAAALDVGSYLAWHDALATPAGPATLLLDGLFMAASVAILAMVLALPHHPAVMFVAITVDYALIGGMLALDPTVTREEPAFSYIVLVAAIFVYLYNLLRFSLAGTLYAGASSIVFVAALVIANGSVGWSPAIALPLVLVLGMGAYLTRTTIHMMREADTKRMMERFLPPQLVSELHSDADALAPGGKAREVTILFSDIRAFTALSEQLAPAEVVSLLNHYLSEMTRIVFAHGGTIDKFVGDAIMTVYGAPRTHADDAARALRTALDMVAALDALNARHPNLPIPIRIGVGVHTGDVIAGNIGSERRLDYTVIGDAVNLASRLEGLTKHYGVTVLASEVTLRQVADDAFVTRLVDTVRVKGRGQSIRVHEVLAAAPAPPELVARKHAFERAHALYTARRFADALAAFRAVPDDPPSSLFAARCEEFLARPPAPDWDGVHEMDTK